MTDSVTQTYTSSVTASFSVTPVSREQAERCSRPYQEWTPDDLVAYVTEEITRIHGPQLPVPGAPAVLVAFAERHGLEKAIRIARDVFEIHHGMWRGAPVTIRRFQPAHDSFFADPVAAGCS